MQSFKTWLIESEAAAQAEALPKVQQFKQEFERLMQFVKKHDYLGVVRTTQVMTVGYPKVALDFLTCLYQHVSGKTCPVRRQLMNLLKIIPASILFGTAALAAPMVLGLELGSLAAAGIKAIQYIYWPFWAWASRNLDNPDPNLAKRAQVMMSAIPDQFQNMLAVSRQDPQQQEWMRSQLAVLLS